jgi:hypothetical protein
VAKRIQLNGIAALLITVALLAVTGLRLLSLGESDDATLQEKVRLELWSELMGEAGETNRRIRESGVYDEALATAEGARPESITILRLSTSRPLFSWRSSDRVIVHVKYRFAGSKQLRERYLEFRHGLIGDSWRYRYDSSTVSYYLNLLSVG